MLISTGLRLHAFLCRQVLRLLMSTGLRFSMSIFAVFPVYMSTGLCKYGVMFFYVLIFNRNVSMYIPWEILKSRVSEMPFPALWGKI